MNTSEQIDAFWKEFTAAEPTFKDLSLQERFDRANAMFQPYFPDVALEIAGTGDDQVAKLIFSAHGNIDCFQLVMSLVNAAPALQYHRVKAFRTRGRPEFVMKMEGLNLSTNDILATCERDGGQIGLRLHFVREIPYDFFNHARDMAFIMLVHVLGEYDFAVKVGFIDFEADESANLQWTPLSKFVPIFDNFWRDTLGRTGLFPQFDESEWQLLEGEANDRQIVVILNSSANAIAMRADLTYAVSLSFKTDDLQLIETAQDVQEKFATLLTLDQSGIPSLTKFVNSRRTTVYYVSDAAHAEQMLRNQLQQAGIHEFELETQFDPSWKKYFYFAAS